MAVLTFEARQNYRGGFSLDAAFETSARVTAIFGPSGCGKTTVVEAIAGMRRCQHERIQIGEVTVSDTGAGIYVPPESRAVGAVFQDLLLFPHRNVAQNLRYGMKLSRGAGPIIEFGRVVEVFELDALLRRPVGSLSGGERQRVALGRALLSRPRLLVLDEPLVALDERLKFRVLGYLERALAEWDVPAIFVSHGHAEVRRLAEWVVLIDAGRVVGAGPPEQALAVPGVMALKNDSRPTGRAPDQPLQLPPPEKPPAGDVFVEVPPESVLVSREDVAGISARNHLRGIVRELVSAGGASFVGIDVGQILWAELTPGAVQELGLARGVEVFCLIKTQSLRVID
jgi:molybdate transport system ATP-binding protein